MIQTPELIELLANDAKPVRRFSSPSVRASCWAAVAAVVVALLAVGLDLRPDVWSQLGTMGCVFGAAASALTAVCAAIAAFNLAVPGRSSWWTLLPLPPLLVWISGIGHQCLTQWVRYDPNGMAMGDTARCFATLVLTSLPLWLLMLLMLRKTKSVQGAFAMLSGGLAVAAATASAMNLLHRLDASAMILLWNFGTGAAIIIISGLFGRRRFVSTLSRKSI